MSQDGEEENSCTTTSIDNMSIHSFSSLHDLKTFIRLNNLPEYDTLTITSSNTRTSPSTDDASPPESRRHTQSLRQKLIKPYQHLHPQPPPEDTQPSPAGAAPKSSTCGKEYCRFGCICDTISTSNGIKREHCGRVECMFECKCRRSTTQPPLNTLTSQNDDSNSPTEASSNERAPSVRRSSNRTKQPAPKLRQHPHNNHTPSTKPHKKPLSPTPSPSPTPKNPKIENSHPHEIHTQNLIIQLRLDKATHSIPLLIESDSEHNDTQSLLKPIARFIRHLHSNNLIQKWHQAEIELDPHTTLRLYSSNYYLSRSEAKNTSNSALVDTRAVIVKVLRLSQASQRIYRARLRLKYEPKITLKPISELSKPKMVKKELVAINSAPKSDESVQAKPKSLPRLLKKSVSNKCVSDDFKEITPWVKRLRPADDAFYNPFGDEKIVLGLYESMGSRTLVDEVCDVVNLMVKGVCLYESHLKELDERKKRLAAEKCAAMASLVPPAPPSGSDRPTRQQLIAAVPVPTIIKPKIVSNFSMIGCTSSSSSNNNNNNNNKRITPILPKLANESSGSLIGSGNKTFVKVITVNHGEKSGSGTGESIRIASKFLTKPSNVNSSVLGGSCSNNGNSIRITQIKASPDYLNAYQSFAAARGNSVGYSPTAIIRNGVKLSSGSGGSAQLTPVQTFKGINPPLIRPKTILKILPKSQVSDVVKVMPIEKELLVTDVDKEKDGGVEIVKVVSPKVDEEVKKDNDDDVILCQEDTMSAIANRKRKRKQDFSEVLRKCISNQNQMKDFHNVNKIVVMPNSDSSVGSNDSNGNNGNSTAVASNPPQRVIFNANQLKKINV